MEGWVEGHIVMGGSSEHVLCSGRLNATISQKSTVLSPCDAGRGVEVDTTVVGGDRRSSIWWGGKMGAGEELERSWGGAMRRVGELGRCNRSRFSPRCIIVDRFLTVHRYDLLRGKNCSWGMHISMHRLNIIHEKQEEGGQFYAAMP